MREFERSNLKIHTQEKELSGCYIVMLLQRRQKSKDYGNIIESEAYQLLEAWGLSDHIDQTRNAAKLSKTQPFAPKTNKIIAISKITTQGEMMTMDQVKNGYSQQTAVEPKEQKIAQEKDPSEPKEQSKK